MHFFEVYSGIGASKYGSAHGVEQLSEHYLKAYPDATVTKITPDESNDPIHHPQAKYIERLTPFFEQTLLPKITDGLTICQQSGRFPIVISGDHANAMGSVAGFLNHYKDKKVGVVWIDAHADMHSVYTSPSGSLHGMPVASVMGVDNRECAVKEVEPAVQAFWQRLKDLSKNKLPTDSIFFLGLRSFESPEAHLVDKHKIFAYSTLEHRKQGIQKIMDELVARLAAFDAVYISFDIDALDDSIIQATGTPEPDGYYPDEMKLILRQLVTLPQVKLFEMTEFNPTLDDNTQKQRVVFELLDEVLALIAKRT